MNRNSLITSLVVIVLLATASLAAVLTGATPRLGLDLQGGISAVYQPDLESGQVPDDLNAALDTAIELIRARVDSLGVAEPDIARQGNDILVQLPGIDDPERAAEIIGTTAQLTFHPVTNFLIPGTPQYDETPPCFVAEDRDGDTLYLPNPDRPSALEDGVVCQGVDDPNDPTNVEPPVIEPTVDATAPGTPTEDATPTGDPSPAPPPTAPGESPTASGVQDTGRVKAAGEATEAPSPTGSPTDTASPTETATSSPAPTPADTPTDLPTEVPTEFDDGLPQDAPRPLKYQVGPPPTPEDSDDPLTGDDITDASPDVGGEGWVTSLDLDSDGAAAFQRITSELACERDAGQGPGQLAIVLDDYVESAPSMNPGVLCGEGIAGGSAVITVGGDQADAQDLALVLDVGALPITLQEATFESVSPTLGADSLRNGLLAGLIGLVLVGAYLVFFYRALGLIALGGLTIFGLLMYGLIVALGEAGFALTLAGVAGIIVSIGITADSSIIFFERIRDEVGLGKTMRTAVKKGFEAAFRTNLAGNTVTFAAALILYFLAVGPVRGFALMLGVATIIDLFIMWAWTRSMVGLLAGSKKITKRTVRQAEPIVGGTS